MQLKHISFGEAGKTFSSLLALVFGIIILASPFVNLQLLMRNKDRLKNKHFREKYGSLYEMLNYNRNPTLSVLIEPTLSQLRLLLMALALIFLEKHYYFQIAINNFLVTFIIIHSKWFEVFGDSKDRFF